jgi:hypothetical protein
LATRNKTKFKKADESIPDQNQTYIKVNSHYSQKQRFGPNQFVSVFTFYIVLNIIIVILDPRPFSLLVAYCLLDSNGFGADIFH